MTSESHARYACDACRLRKMSCSRELPECSRCKTQEITCSYSRSGILRRNRKRRAATPARAIPDSTHSSPYPQSVPPSPPAQGTVTERLQRLAGKEHTSLKDLGSLMSDYHSIWQDSGAFDVLAENAQMQYHSFDQDQGRAWVDAMSTVLRQDKMVISSAPSDVLDALTTCRPVQTIERAWLVMFYSIALKGINETVSPDYSAKLKSNLWLTFNDARLLLEPSILNIQALLTMALYAEKVLTPYACWSIVSKACTMLLALGVGTHAHIDPTTKKLRDKLFWRLESLDKSLALILGRSPLFQRDLTKKISLPALEELLSEQPRYTNDGMPVLFEAHFVQQMYSLSRIKVEVWHCLPGQETHNVNHARNELTSWYSEASKVLEASALVEKPLLSARGHASVDLRLQTLLFNFYYLEVLLAVASKDRRTQCIIPAQALLGLLPRLGELLSDNTDQRGSLMIWEWLHYPMMAFGTLWGQILSKAISDSEESKKIFEILYNVPKFLEKIQSRHTMARRLKDITERIIQHINIIHHSGPPVQEQRTSAVDHACGAVQPQILADPAQAIQPIDIPSTSTDATFDTSLDGLISLPDDFFLDPTFDWFSWGDQMLP